MAEPTTAEPGATPGPGATPEPPPSTTPPEPEAGKTDQGELGDAGRKALSEARLEAKRQKARADTLEAEQKKREDAEKSELEKVTGERDELQTRITTLEREGRARSAAAEAGVPDLWDRLKGDTVEELLEDAKAIAERFGRRVPGTDLGAGARPGTTTAGMNERIRRSARG